MTSGQISGRRSSAGRVVVVGGGITGLSAAYDLSRGGADVVLLEQAARLGGNIRTERVAGFVIDAGPDSFVRSKPEGTALCNELGLKDELVETRARRVYLTHRGRLEALPDGMVLGAPTRLAPLVSTRLLSIPGKLRALFDLVMPASTAEDESIESFLTRRLGREVAARIAGPLLSGIYAGDVSALSIRSTFPQLCELEQRGGLIRGLTRQARASGGRHSPFYSLAGGMGTLVERLADSLGGVARTRAAVRRITRASSARFTLELESGERLEAAHVLLTCPAHVAARLVPDADLGGELAGIPYVSTATVFAALRRSDVSHALDGVGFVATAGEARILAGTWVSSKWPGRAPDGHVLCRAFLGGAAAGERIETATDNELEKLALGELERLMGPLGQPLFTRVYRFVDSNPQPVLGHRARLSRIRDRLRELPGLELCGAAYDGVGIPDCIRQGRAAANRILEASTPSEVTARQQATC